MNSKRNYRRIFLVLGLVAVILVLVVSGVYLSQRYKLIFNRPLVLIFSPFNREQISLKETVWVNANARAKVGVERIEVWIDGAFFFAQEAEEGGALPADVINVPWNPGAPGKHTILVRAYSSNGVDGQASIDVFVVEELAEAPPSDMEETDGGSGAGGGGSSPAGGGASGGSPPSGGAPPPSDGSSPPRDTLPGSPEDIGDSLGIESDDSDTILSSDPVGLRVEALALYSPGSYESLHCYIEAGLLVPQWYPDADHNQATHESFAPLGSGEWDIAAHLSGSNAPIFMWPGNEAMPLNLTCVGIYPGGAESDELGHVNISATPDMWDNVPRRAESSGGEGSFVVEYRFSLGVPDDRGFWATIDGRIPAPTNLRMEGTLNLHWDWEPDPEIDPELSIDGFYVYLNGTLQFIIEDPDTRSISLPPEWIMPPCGIAYVYTVQAFLYDTEDDTGHRESNFSEPLTIRRDELEECDISAFVTFDGMTLTAEAGFSDEGRTDRVGPMFIAISACSGVHCFSQGVAGGDVVFDTIYGLSAFMGSRGIANYGRIPLTSEGISLRYQIFNQNGDDWELWCEGRTHIPAEDLHIPDFGPIFYPGFINSPDDRCNVTFTISTELVADYTGIEFPPLPSLYVFELMFNPAGDYYEIDIRNSTGASWAGYDLEVLLTRESTGEEFSSFVWPGLTLGPGEGALITSDVIPSHERPYDVCVTLDPNNLVLETLDRSFPDWTPPPWCWGLPDIAIISAGFADDDQTMVITIQNQGTGDLSASTLDIEIVDHSSGYSEIFTPSMPFMGLRPWETTTFEIPLLDEPLEDYETRINYSINVDPSDRIVELNEANNSFYFDTETNMFELRWDGFDYGSYEVDLAGYTWTGLYVPWFDRYDGHNYDQFSAEVYVDNGITRRHIGRMAVSCMVPYGLRHDGPTTSCSHDVTFVEPLTFQLANGEGVSVYVQGRARGDPDSTFWTDLGSFWLYFDYPAGGGARCEDLQPYGVREWGYVYNSYSVHPWYAAFTLCRLPPDE